MTTEHAPARFVWTDAHGDGRNLYACFRRSFTVPRVPHTALLHLFADTFYNLFVNGAFVHCGPVRFDPRAPCFDTIDLAAHLRPGINTLAVLVNSFQHKTYKAIAPGSSPGAPSQLTATHASPWIRPVTGAPCPRPPTSGTCPK